ncbi:Dynactin subunit 4-like protein [Leptotrombidium deliense]|uniref:Dynactin subunit 4 n=1 Tax=Leptotrombidium deliense TaxID=299467 RepID=A0A443SQ09_9ACAR|nr:Dynactin subunit 4-like protein [Leptotrombidium deliense]
MSVNVNSVFFSTIVRYQCSCGQFQPFSSIYFCRHCVKLRCKLCVSHEVDSQYCQHCLEYIPTIDAKLKKNKCASCYSCPSCTHTLSTKVSLVPVKNEANQFTSKKSYVLICSYCKWTSKDVGIADQFAATGGWPETEVADTKRIDALFEYYKLVAQKEKLEKEKKRMVHGQRPGHAIHLLDKYGISASLSPKVTETLRAKLYSGKLMANNYSSDKSVNELKAESAKATDVCVPLDVDLYYKKRIEIMSESSIEQRITQIELQPCNVASFYPISKMLSVKRSLRCKQCDHNLSKPEYNPSSIKFKIRLSAFYDIPELQVSKVPQLIAHKPCLMELTIKNPTQYLTHISFLNDAQYGSSIGQVHLPQQQLLLPPNDDTLELDTEHSDNNKYNDDPKVVSFRRGNKLGIFVTVVPNHEKECKLVFCMKHDFVHNSMQVNGDKGTQRSWVIHNVMLDLTSFMYCS